MFITAFFNYGYLFTVRFISCAFIVVPRVHNVGPLSRALSSIVGCVCLLCFVGSFLFPLSTELASEWHLFGYTLHRVSLCVIDQWTVG